MAIIEPKSIWDVINKVNTPIYAPYIPMQVTKGLMDPMELKQILRCFCCNKEIEAKERRIAILSLCPSDPASYTSNFGSPAQRVTYCVQCFIDVGSQPILDALSINGENSPKANVGDSGWVKPFINEPLEPALNWYCEVCHTKLSQIEKTTLTNSHSFYCSGCCQGSYNVVYKV